MFRQKPVEIKEVAIAMCMYCYSYVAMKMIKVAWFCVMCIIVLFTKTCILEAQFVGNLCKTSSYLMPKTDVRLLNLVHS